MIYTFKLQKKENKIFYRKTKKKYVQEIEII